ncbi:uncharacterized protein LOC135161816 [Diachasmimorpha longicaudata]|uniref:uncharacterized protein LOC135161816 n=1 Tax=Diachasmimorpha longicaudata TaxID=58733 RepID=UPI0030B8AE4B
MNDPERYAKSNGMPYHHVNDLIKEFAEEFKEMRGRIIDIGCGPGNVTRELLLPSVNKDAVIVGADISEDMVEHAREHYKLENKLSFLQLDIATPKLSNNLIGQFDNVVSFYCLQWCRNTKLTMENIYKLLRPDGKAIILLVSQYMIYDIYLEQQKDPKFAAHMHDCLKFIAPHHGFSNPEEMLREDLEGVGFEILHCSNRWKTFTYSSLDNLSNSMVAINPFLKRMPDDLKEDYKIDLKKRIQNEYVPQKSIENDNNCNIEARISLLTAMFKKPSTEVLDQVNGTVYLEKWHGTQIKFQFILQSEVAIISKSYQTTKNEELNCNISSTNKSVAAGKRSSFVIHSVKTMEPHHQSDENDGTKRRRDPQKYLTVNKLQYEGIAELVGEFSDTLKNMHGLCLDLGCGSGIQMKDLILPNLANDARLVGGEESEQMTEFAKKCCEGVTRVSFTTINIGEMRIPNTEIEKYNNIISFYYLHTFHNTQRTTRNIARLLAAGGQGLVMFLSHHDVYDLYLEYQYHPSYKQYMEDIFHQLPPLYGCPSAANTVKDELEKAGLKIITCTDKELTFVYDSMEDVENTLVMTDPFIDRMPNDVKKLYRKEITERFSKNKMKDGKIVDKYRLVVALFHK